MVLALTGRYQGFRRPFVGQRPDEPRDKRHHSHQGHVGDGCIRLAINGLLCTRFLSHQFKSHLHSWFLDAGHGERVL